MFSKSFYDISVVFKITLRFYYKNCSLAESYVWEMLKQSQNSLKQLNR